MNVASELQSTRRVRSYFGIYSPRSRMSEPNRKSLCIRGHNARGVTCTYSVLAGGSATVLTRLHSYCSGSVPVSCLGIKISVKTLSNGHGLHPIRVHLSHRFVGCKFKFVKHVCTMYSPGEYPVSSHHWYWALIHF